MSLEDLLVRTSRTFALAIPLLPDGLRAEVGLAYLLFRVADTLEDAELWSGARRAQALAEFLALLEREPVAFDWLSDPPTADAATLDLLASVHDVLGALALMTPRKRDIVAEHVARTARGMRDFALRGHDVRTLEELQQYCYVVAGIVGEMLTRLFEHEREAALLELAAPFGEGLQLVNVLRDRAVDAAEGRRLLPVGVPIDEIAGLARRDLDAADRYVALLEGAHPGIVRFCQLPVRLARPTLERVLVDGPGAKLTRDEVARILAALA